MFIRKIFRELYPRLQRYEITRILMLDLIFGIFAKMLIFYRGGPLGKMIPFSSIFGCFFAVKQQATESCQKVSR